MLATIQVVVLAAAEEGNPDQWLLPDFAELLWGFVAFALLMAFMSWKVFPKAGATLDERSARIQGQLEEAENQRQQHHPSHEHLHAVLWRAYLLGKAADVKCCP